jgi:putative RecB family exonuclease
MTQPSDPTLSQIAQPAVVPRLSFSKLKRWEECPKNYWFHYFLRLPGLFGLWALLGTILHKTLEVLEREAIAKGSPGHLSKQHALRVYRNIAMTDGLVGIEAFQDGWTMTQDWVTDRGYRDPRHILALEQPFTIKVGRFDVNGVIDRVNRGPDGVTEVEDYKTQRDMFRKEELETNLQLSIYEAAARQIWPDTKEVRLAMWMLRHRQWQRTSRTPDQLEAALAYVEILGEQIATATEYPARLGSHCGYCDYRHRCDEYKQAIAGERDIPPADLGDLAAVGREREELVSVHRIVKRRKNQLDTVLKKHLRNEPELVVDGTTYRFFQTTSLEHDLQQAARMIERTAGVPAAEVIERVGAVDKKRLEQLLAELAPTLGRPRAELLKHEIDAVTEPNVSQRL